LGVLTGDLSCLLVLDVDGDEGRESLHALEAAHGTLPVTVQSKTRRGHHIYFQNPKGYNIRGSVGKLGPGLDIRANGSYIVAPPSRHVTGQYEWLNQNSLVPIPNWLLGILEGPTAKKTGNTAWRNYIPQGQRNSILASLAGTMRKRGMTQPAIEAALAAENRSRCDPPLSEIEVRSIARSIGNYPAGHADTAICSPGADWPDPGPILDELPPVQSLARELVPVSLRALVEDTAERMQVPVDYPAATVVLCLAGCVNRRASIQPKMNDSSWIVIPNLWGGIVAHPGFLKSPVIQTITHPLVRIESEWFRQYEIDMAEYERVKEMKQKGEEDPEEPTLRRLLVNDSTFEKLHVTMSENPVGIFLLRDELTGWWSTLDRRGREGERAFCLEAWNGDKPFTIDRISRGTIRVPACCMSMLGGIQPGRLRGYLIEALDDGPANDGLIQRFQVLVWPDTTSEWTLVDRLPNQEAQASAERVFRALVNLPEPSKVLKFSPRAQDLFYEWLPELEAKIRAGKVHTALISHLSKYRSLMPSLALLFELADWTGGRSDGEAVSLEHARQAAAWCDYLETHAARVYSCVASPQRRAARTLSEKIKSKEFPRIFTLRDIYNHDWSGLDSAEATEAAVKVLENAAWLRQLPIEYQAAGGRPSARYEVNPKVYREPLA
jgi:putative DNA primase/helicase